MSSKPLNSQKKPFECKSKEPKVGRLFHLSVSGENLALVDLRDDKVRPIRPSLEKECELHVGGGSASGVEDICFNSKFLCFLRKQTQKPQFRRISVDL